MRKIDVDLAKIKLAQFENQKAKIANRLAKLQAEVVEVTNSLNEKQSQIETQVAKIATASQTETVTE